ncbi:MAG: nucleotidyltransferase family protein [Clostridia bacterium]|nr:nucleotidyltransferase family protein [Clostridia bacterium]
MRQDKIIANIREIMRGESSPDPDTIRFLNQHEAYYLLSKIPIYKSKQAVYLAVNQVAVKERYKACEALFKELNSSDISYAVIKGAVLSEQIYGSTAYRRSGDIDLLIAPDAIQNVKTILEKHGFIQGRVVNDQIIPYSRQELIYQKTFTHQMAAFVKKMDSKLCPFINVDVNVDIFWGESSRKADMTTFLRNTQMYKIHDILIRKLDPVFEFISLCMHHYKDFNSLYLLADRGIKLSHFCDLFYYITNVSPDLQELKKVCCTYGVTEYVAFCIYHTNRLFPNERLQAYLAALTDGANNTEYNRFGLTESEYKYLDFGISDYILDEELGNTFRSSLTAQDRTKIEINRKYM